MERITREEFRVLVEAPAGPCVSIFLPTHHTILNSGTVYAVEPGDMPDATPLAAVFRY